MDKQRSSDEDEFLSPNESTAWQDAGEVIHRPAADPNTDLVQFYFRDIRPISSLLSLDDEQSRDGPTVFAQRNDDLR